MSRRSSGRASEGAPAEALSSTRTHGASTCGRRPPRRLPAQGRGRQEGQEPLRLGALCQGGPRVTVRKMGGRRGKLGAFVGGARGAAWQAWVSAAGGACSWRGWGWRDQVGEAGAARARRVGAGTPERRARERACVHLPLAARPGVTVEGGGPERACWGWGAVAWGRDLPAGGLDGTPAFRAFRDDLARPPVAHRGKGRGSGGEGTDREKGQSGTGPEDSGQREARPWVGRLWWSLHPEGQRWVQAQTTPALLVPLVAGRRRGAVARGQRLRTGPTVASQTPGGAVRQPRQAPRHPWAGRGGACRRQAGLGGAVPGARALLGKRGRAACVLEPSWEHAAGAAPFPGPVRAAEIPAPQVPEARGEQVSAFQTFCKAVSRLGSACICSVAGVCSRASSLGTGVSMTTTPRNF